MMKRILILVLSAILLPVWVWGQSKQINEILDRYEKKRNVESILISPSLLQIAGSSSVDASTKDLLSKITELRILNVKQGAVEGGVPVRVTLKGELEKLFTGELFTRVVRVQDGSELLEMYVTKNNPGVLLFLTTTPNEMSIISIFGNIDKSVINAAMSGEIKIK